MSIEFVGDESSFNEALAELFGGILGAPQEPLKLWGESADLERVEKALALYHEYKETASASHAKAMESGMLTPRITLREHSDMHAFMNMMDEFMVDVVKDWRLAVAVWAVGGTENTYEILRERMQQMLEMSVIRFMLDDMHLQWARENATDPE